MDPLTALSVAANVVQFVDFTAKIFSETRQLYEEGQLDVHAQTSIAIKDLSSFSKEMTRSIRSEESSGNLTENETKLEQLYTDCGTLADEMVARLQKFQVSERRKIWRSVGQVLKSMWSAKELEAMEKKLSRYRDAMNSRLLGSLRERVDQILREQYVQKSAINDHTRRVVASALLELHASFTRDLQEQTTLLSALINQKNPIKLNSKEIDDSLVTEIRQRSSGYAATADDAKVYSKIQRTEAGLHQLAVQAVLKSLSHETITERYEAVAEAHLKTFEWIFKPMADEDDPGVVHWSDFVQWLRQGQGIYWINGKAAPENLR